MQLAIPADYAIMKSGRKEANKTFNRKKVGGFFRINLQNYAMFSRETKEFIKSLKFIYWQLSAICYYLHTRKGGKAYDN